MHDLRLFYGKLIVGLYWAYSVYFGDI